MSDLSDKTKALEKKEQELQKTRDYLGLMEKEIIKYKEQIRLLKLEGEEKDLELDSMRHKHKQ